MKQSPILKDGKRVIDINRLPDKIKAQVLKHAVFDMLKDQAKKQIKANQIDIEKYFKQFVKNLNPNTKKAYTIAITHYMAYLKKIGVDSPLLAGAEQIDSYVQELKTLGFRANSIRLKISAISSFYARLKRYNHVEKNPARGTALPKKHYKKSPINSGGDSPIIDDEDFSVLLNHSKGKLRLAIHLMGCYGLRVGALSHIVIKGNEFFYTTKGGREGRQTLLSQTLLMLDRGVGGSGGGSGSEVDEKNHGENSARLSQEQQPSLGQNFTKNHILGNSYEGSSPSKKLPTEKTRTRKKDLHFNTATIQKSLARLVKKLRLQKKLSTHVSCHDLRHYFAVTHYQKHRDIYQLKMKLDHANVSITDIYLQSLKIK